MGILTQGGAAPAASPTASLTSGYIPVAGSGGALSDGPAYASAVLTLTNAGGTASFVASGQLNSTFQLYNDAGTHNFLIQSKGSGSNQLRIQNDGATKITINSTGAVRFGDANAPSLTLESAGAVGAATYLKSGSYTVATLPAAATAGAGARAMVTDANSTTFMSTVAGGGANIVPVVDDGTNWKIG